MIWAQVKGTDECVFVFLSLLIYLNNEINTLLFTGFVLSVLCARYFVSSVTFCGLAWDVK